MFDHVFTFTLPGRFLGFHVNDHEITKYPNFGLAAHSWQAKKRWPKIWLIQSIRKCECSIQQIKNKICCLWVNHSINLFNARIPQEGARDDESWLVWSENRSEDGFDQSHTREDALMEVASERIFFFFGQLSLISAKSWTLAEAQLTPFSHSVSLGRRVFQIGRKRFSLRMLCRLPGFRPVP